MAHVFAPFTVTHPAQPVGISRHGTTYPSTGIGEVGIHATENPGMVHFPQRAAFQRATVGTIAHGPRRHVVGYVLRIIFNGRNQPAHRAIDAIVQQGNLRPGTLTPAVAVGQSGGGYLGVFPLGVRHAERCQDVFVDVVLVGFSGYFFDDIAQ